MVVGPEEAVPDGVIERVARAETVTRADLLPVKEESPDLDAIPDGVTVSDTIPVSVPVTDGEPVVEGIALRVIVRVGVTERLTVLLRVPERVAVTVLLRVAVLLTNGCATKLPAAVTVASDEAVAASERAAETLAMEDKDAKDDAEAVPEATPIALATLVPLTVGDAVDEAVVIAVSVIRGEALPVLEESPEIEANGEAEDEAVTLPEVDAMPEAETDGLPEDEPVAKEAEAVKDAVGERVALTPPETTADAVAKALRLRVADAEALLNKVTVTEVDGETVIVFKTDALLVFVTVPDGVKDVVTDALFDIQAVGLTLRETELEAVREEIALELAEEPIDAETDGLIEEVLETLGERVWVGDVVVDDDPLGVTVTVFERRPE